MNQDNRDSEKSLVSGKNIASQSGNALKTANSDILYGRNGKSSSEYLNYWLSTPCGMAMVWIVLGKYSVENDTYMYSDANRRSARSYRNRSIFNIIASKVLKGAHF